jgi:hypothetical protein
MQGLARIPVLVTAVAAVCIWLTIGAAAPLTLGRVSWAASLACQVITVCLGLRVARRLPPGDPDRRFWQGGAAAEAILATAYSMQLLLTSHGGTAQQLPLTNVLNGVAVLIVIAAVIWYPLPTVGKGERVRFSLDLATVLVGAGSLVWYGSYGLGPLDVLTGPLILLLAAFAFGKLLIFGKAPYTRRTGVIFAGAGVAAAAGLTLFDTFKAEGHVGVGLALSSLGDGLIMIGSWLQLTGPGNLMAVRRRRQYSHLPYVAIAASYVLLLVALSRDGLTGRTWLLLGGMAISTALVVVRQLASFADNARLVGELQHALDERNTLADRLHRMAYEDHLTGLANRAMLQQTNDRRTADRGEGRRPGRRAAHRPRRVQAGQRPVRARCRRSCTRPDSAASSSLRPGARCRRSSRWRRVRRSCGRRADAVAPTHRATHGRGDLRAVHGGRCGGRHRSKHRHRLRPRRPS